MPLRHRLALTYGGLLLLIMAAFGTVLFVAMGRALSAEMDRRLEVRASQVELAVWPDPKAPPAGDLASDYVDLAALNALKAPTLFVQLVELGGQVVARSTNLQPVGLPVEAEGLRAGRSGQRKFGEVSFEDNHPVRIMSVPVFAGDRIAGVLQVGQSRLPLRRTMEDLALLLLVLGAAAVAGGSALGWWVADRSLRPLQTMARRAGAIAAEGDFRRRVGPVAQTDEIGQLADTVDRLLETVEATLDKHNEFVADTSHELRNPLLAIQTNLELLQQLPTVEDQTECVMEAAQQVHRMSRLVADLLVLARADADQLIERQLVALRPLVQRIAEETQHGAGDRTVVVGRCDPVHLQADEDRVAQMLVNLMDNAIQHTSPRGRIVLSLEQENNWALLSVADDGDGISERDLPHIFERFYRAPEDKRRNAPGTGLGLAIVKHLAEAHGGRVSVQSARGSGSSFTIWLPLVADEPALHPESVPPVSAHTPLTV